ncbi:inositol 2-dehydrogenase-like protein [Dinothrombium tinctorium]|uniref:Inositol 2-dehydrogenase-like protein n=1 Tax=Dinothrombium tinctorium TaxID=1965070 RepID=A0A3S3QAL1_9ACAR|nr:inositol 2-dehydrogenase-like protein [Dinothrombium tinctorium]RWS16350.1 inositol 2-dehydrogenase-like protein [Dinothrombium tinctorium]RWS16845.1 inositol 2-dehydrogenase-like protein [Dinothrombium tinctorium]RWS16863.1 inositol 2-dehydrogenase-like protein [Dinothrombium tinctorium]
MKCDDLKGKKLIDECNDGLKLNSKVRKDGDGIYQENKIVRMALFGLGRIGTIHLEKLLSHPSVKLMYCVEMDEKRTQFVKYRYNLNHVKFLTQNEEDTVFNDEEVDAVIIGTPTKFHEKLVIKALEARKGIFCEKPLAVTFEGMRRCYLLANKFNLPLLCAFNRRFDPSFRQIKDRVERGEIGQVQVVKTCSRDHPSPPIEYLKTSGGIFHDCAIHDIDMICWIVGEYPISVYAEGHAFIPEIAEIGDYDTVFITMKFATGVIATIDLSRNAVYGYDQRLEVFGNKGMLCSNGVRPTAVEHHSSIGTTQVPICNSFATRYAESYNIEVEHFINCMKGTQQIEVKDFQTLAVNKVASCCEESAKHRKLIEIPKSMYEFGLAKKVDKLAVNEVEVIKDIKEVEEIAVASV